MTMIACCARCAWCSLGVGLAALRPAELAVQLAQAYRPIGELTVQVEHLSAWMVEFERRGRRDSSTSTRPPSSDSAAQWGREPVAAGAGQAEAGQAAGRVRDHDEADR